MARPKIYPDNLSRLHVPFAPHELRALRHEAAERDLASVQQFIRVVLAPYLPSEKAKPVTKPTSDDAARDELAAMFGDVAANPFE